MTPTPLTYKIYEQGPNQYCCYIAIEPINVLVRFTQGYGTAENDAELRKEAIEKPGSAQHVVLQMLLAALDKACHAAPQRTCDTCAKGSQATGKRCDDSDCRHGIPGSFPRWEPRAARAAAEQA